VLAVNRGDLAQHVRSSLIDPFHNNAVIPQYLVWLTQHWDATTRDHTHDTDTRGLG
jgi:hypothetical protein